MFNSSLHITVTVAAANPARASMRVLANHARTGVNTSNSSLTVMRLR
jgi:hypothetical protein